VVEAGVGSEVEVAAVQRVVVGEAAVVETIDGVSGGIKKRAMGVSDVHEVLREVHRVKVEK
jgi:hypothetical protein